MTRKERDESRRMRQYSLAFPDSDEDPGSSNDTSGKSSRFDVGDSLGDKGWTLGWGGGVGGIQQILNARCIIIPCKYAPRNDKSLGGPSAVYIGMDKESSAVLIGVCEERLIHTTIPTASLRTPESAHKNLFILVTNKESSEWVFICGKMEGT